MEDVPLPVRPSDQKPALPVQAPLLHGELDGPDAAGDALEGDRRGREEDRGPIDEGGVAAGREHGHGRAAEDADLRDVRLLLEGVDPAPLQAGLSLGSLQKHDHATEPQPVTLLLDGDVAFAPAGHRRSRRNLRLGDELSDGLDETNSETILLPGHHHRRHVCRHTASFPDRWTERRSEVDPCVVRHEPWLSPVQEKASCPAP